MEERYWNEDVAVGYRRASAVLRISEWTLSYWSEIGKKRDCNEDRCCVIPDIGTALLLDGMGGHPGGRVFAENLTECMSRALGAGFTPQEAMRLAMMRSIDVAGALKSAGGGAMALCAAVRKDGLVDLVGIGDAVAMLVEPNGSMTELLAQIRAAGRRGHLGPQQDWRAIERVLVEVPSGGALLLMSDGVASYIPRLDLARAVRSLICAASDGRLAETVREATHAMIRSAQSHGSPDDASVVVLAHCGV